MSLIEDAIKRLEEVTSTTGCQDCNVTLSHAPEGTFVCQYVNGIPLLAEFGGNSATMVTSHPVETRTRIPFMFGKKIEAPTLRTAACAIMNVVTSFLCLHRKGHACTPDKHAECAEALIKRLKGARVHTAGPLPEFYEITGAARAETPSVADLIVVSGEGLCTDDGLASISAQPERDKVLFIGPSTAGVAVLLGYEHWCPYGKR